MPSPSSSMWLAKVCWIWEGLGYANLLCLPGLPSWVIDAYCTVDLDVPKCDGSRNRGSLLIISCSGGRELFHIRNKQPYLQLGTAKQDVQKAQPPVTTQYHRRCLLWDTPGTTTTVLWQWPSLTLQQVLTVPGAQASHNIWDKRGCWELQGKFHANPKQYVVNSFFWLIGQIFLSFKTFPLVNIY